MVSVGEWLLQSCGPYESVQVGLGCALSPGRPLGRCGGKEKKKDEIQ